MGVGGFDADSVQISDFSRQRGDHVLRRVDGDGDDADAAFAVGDAHASDDVAAVFVEQGIERLGGVAVFNDDSHDGDTGGCCHDVRLRFDKKIRLYLRKAQPKKPRRFADVDEVWQHLSDRNRVIGGILLSGIL